MAAAAMGFNGNDAQRWRRVHERERHGGSAVVPSSWLLGLLAGGACQHPACVRGALASQRLHQFSWRPAKVSMATTRGVGKVIVSV